MSHGSEVRSLSIEIRATKEKETRGTWRFEADDASAPVRYVYIRKDAFADGEVPQKIIITIEVDHAYT